MKVRDRVKLYKDDKSIEVEALFNSGSARSYVSDRVAEKIGYEPYPRPIKVYLAVEGYEAEVIGYITAFLEIADYVLPELEILGVIKGLRVDAIIGVNVMEPYQIILEKDKVTFKVVPPRAFLI